MFESRRFDGGLDEVRECTEQDLQTTSADGGWRNTRDHRTAFSLEG
jgi:hypothetical protein